MIFIENWGCYDRTKVVENQGKKAESYTVENQNQNHISVEENCLDQCSLHNVPLDNDSIAMWIS